eukprot:GAFH01005025.1.p3 GENE.GAFH01005025.1~~GAFH01005025.1.p3  ORF type:complete len:82 (-),score=12.60 GAFH01005025.1:276-521(-)
MSVQGRALEVEDSPILTGSTEEDHVALGDPGGPLGEGLADLLLVGLLVPPPDLRADRFGARLLVVRHLAAALLLSVHIVLE